LATGRKARRACSTCSPDDLWAKLELAGSRLGVRLVTWPQKIENALADRGEEFRRSVEGLRYEQIGGGRVSVVHREIDIDADVLAAYPGLLPRPDHRPTIIEDGPVVGDTLRPVLCLDPDTANAC
jgi:hypothetical protein